MRARLSVRLRVVPVLAAVFVIAAAAPAWAHAILISTNPPTDGVVAVAPGQLSLTYSENVEASFGAIRVYTCAGKRIATGAPQHASRSDHTVVVSIPRLADGVYLVSWRVISADSHPVNGTYSFRVGPGAPTSVSGCATETTAKSSTTVGVLLGMARAGVFVGLALLIGAVVFLLLIAGGTSAAASTRRTIWIGWLVLTVSTIFALMLQGPYAAGAGVGDAFRWSVTHDVLQTRLGHVTELRLGLLAAALALLRFIGPVVHGRRAPIWWSAAAAIVGVGLAATPGLAGHAATGDFTIFAVPLDTIHVLAMSVWLGGLVAVLAAAMAGGFKTGQQRALRTFSRVAFWCVIVLVLSGLFASWRQVGFTTSGYTDTSYGNTLLVKLAIVVALVGVAAVSRSIVRRRRATPADAPESAIAAIDERTVAALRRSVMGEVVLGLAVVAVTALLVNAQPARSALTPRLFSGSTIAGNGAMTIEVTVDPARVGLNQIHVYTLTSKGATLPIRGISAKLVLGALSVPAGLVKAGPNHYLTNSAAIPTRGRYQMLIEVEQILNGQLIDTAGVLTVPIR